jgi:hypothetical protein
VSVVLILLAHKRRSPSAPWLYYCPVGFLALSIVQFQNSLWGFQIAWYLVLLALATVIFVVDRIALTWFALIGAIAVGVVGSFSSLQGLIIWPVGLLLLYSRRRQLAMISAWIGSAIASGFAYFYHFNFSIGAPNSAYAFDHPLVALRFFLFIVGDVVGQPGTADSSSANDVIVLVFGLGVVFLAVATEALCGLRPTSGSSPVGVALIFYGLLFAAVTTQGRANAGLVQAGASRYTTFTLMILIGVYLALLGRWTATATTTIDTEALRVDDSTIRGTGGGPGRRPGWVDRVAVPWALAITLLACLVQISFGSHNGLEGAQRFNAEQVKAAETLIAINRVSDAELANAEVYVPLPFLREQVLTLEQHHLSVFARG